MKKPGEHQLTVSHPARNVRIGGRRTSLRLEPVLWAALEEIARQERTTIDELCTRVEAYRRNRGRTSMLRSFIVAYLVQRTLSEPWRNVSVYDRAIAALD